jgi:hypothetical protein
VTWDVECGLLTPCSIEGDYQFSMLRIREVTGSNLSKGTDYPSDIFHTFPQSLQANAGIVP